MGGGDITGGISWPGKFSKGRGIACGIFLWFHRLPFSSGWFQSRNHNLSSMDIVWYCCLHIKTWTELINSQIKATKWLRMQGSKVNKRSRISKGSRRVEINMVNPGTYWMRKRTTLGGSHFSLYLLAKHSLTLAIESLTTPEWSM